MASTRLVYCLVGIVTILVLTVAASVGVLVWRYATCREESLPELFPGYFRNAEQQFLFLAQFNNETGPLDTYPPKKCGFYCPGRNASSPVEVTTLSTNNNNTTELFAGQRGRRDVSNVGSYRQVAPLTDSRVRQKRDVPAGATVLFGPVYHACCQSWRIVTTPVSAETLGGEVVELVQNVAGFSQYFVSEYFEEESTCENCQCYQPVPFVYSAVYYKDKRSNNFKKKYGVTSIKLPGCCKCLNI
ncbi:uncharacterized protein LOC135464772 isoform X2 [Liolophura sinensis]|uniref:uncharacterized protein LOC135464772 isoform X2 n=1 Tax=Liolophura sinensis TaxID=3198878 RepID=UPI003158CCFA